MGNKQNKRENQSKKYKGIVFIVISAFCFALMNMFVKLAGDLPPIQKSFFRNIIAFITASIILAKNRESMKTSKESYKFLILRSILGTLGILLNFYAIDHLPLADASMLNKMSPFFAIIFSYFILNEKLTIFQALVVVGAFIGSMFVVKPSFSNVALIPALAGLLGGLSAGWAYTLVRKLGLMGTKGPFIIFFFSCFSCLTTLPFLLFGYHSMTVLQFGYLILAGLSATGGQFAITAAYYNAPAKEISVYDYSQIPFAAILGLIVFSQIPDAYSLLGYVIIISMAILMYLYNIKGYFKNSK